MRKILCWFGIHRWRKVPDPRNRRRRLRAFERRVYRLKNLPSDIAQAIKASKMDATHEHLNALLDEK
jgi:hypothetical protein